MEYAIYKGKKISASDVAENYESEKEIRIASANKMLFCPDAECDNRVLRYCHGDEKEAYFAHLNNANCDYANFDRENTKKLHLIRKNYIIFLNKMATTLIWRVKLFRITIHILYFLFRMVRKRL